MKRLANWLLAPKLSWAFLAWILAVPYAIRWMPPLAQMVVYIGGLILVLWAESRWERRTRMERLQRLYQWAVLARVRELREERGL